jgi:hypothetical protein
MHAKFLSVTVKGREHLEELGINDWIILEWVLGKQGGKVWTGFIWLRISDGIL